jgi:hypothetical protein
MLQYFLNDISVPYTGNDLHVAATFIAYLDKKVENIFA